MKGTNLTRLTFIFVLANFVYTLIFGIWTIGTVFEFKETQRLVEIQQVAQNQQNTIFKKQLLKITEMVIDNDTSFLNSLKKVNDSLVLLTKVSGLLTAEIQKLQPLSEEDSEKIEFANVLLYNKREGWSGSGTVVRFNKRYYILTCAHLQGRENNLLWAQWKDGFKIPIDLVKMDTKLDIALYKLPAVSKKFIYLELSDKLPYVGCDLIVIGNPSSFTGVLTKGNLVKILKNGYMYSNLIFFGNSGGGILYEGKIVGVVSQIRTFYSYPQFVNYGIGVKLEDIKKFLNSIEEIKDNTHTSNK